MAFSGELRATGQVLRDQFVFMLRAGFDAFEVKKDSDAEAFASTVQALFGVLSADRRWPPHRALHRRMQLRHAESAAIAVVPAKAGIQQSPLPVIRFVTGHWTIRLRGVGRPVK